MRYNTGLTAAPASPLYGSPVCKRSPIQVLTVLNVAHIGLLHIGFLHVGFLFMIARVFVYRVIEIGFLISGFDLESFYACPRACTRKSKLDSPILYTILDNFF
jgi:hypothetical protein